MQPRRAALASCAFRESAACARVRQRLSASQCCAINSLAPSSSGFGSFHGGNVDALYASAAGDQGAPPWVDPPALAPRDDLLPAAGAAALRLGPPAASLFCLDLARWVFVNHGAFGGAFKAAARYADRVREVHEANPVAFIDRRLFRSIVAVVRRLARFTNASPRNIVLVPNATTGINAVVKSVLPQQRLNQRVLCLDIGYASVAKLLKQETARGGLQLVTAGTPRPPNLSADSIVGAVERALDAVGEPFALAVVDWVTSNTALKLPVERIAAACKQRGVPLLVDAAHALGPIAIDLTALGADFVVANAHKHLCAPKGAAMLYVAERWQPVVRPLCTSHGANAGFHSAFIWDGARDYAPALAVAAALDVWERVGVTRAREYMCAMRAAAVQALTSRWGTQAYAAPEMLSNMALVALPANCAPDDGATPTESDAKALQDWLFHARAIESPVKAIDGKLYVRITAHWYNGPEDFVALADAVVSYLHKRDCKSYGD